MGLNASAAAVSSPSNTTTATTANEKADNVTNYEIAEHLPQQRVTRAEPIAAPQPGRTQPNAVPNLKAPFCGSPLLGTMTPSSSAVLYENSTQSRLSAAPLLSQLNPETASAGSAKRYMMTGFPLPSLSSSHSSDATAPARLAGRQSIDTTKETPLPARQRSNIGSQLSGGRQQHRGSISTVPTLITWNGGGKDVYVAGSFNDWRRKIPLSKSQQDFSVLLQLPEGTNRLKFIVDGEWKCSNDLDSALDPTGNLVNYLEVVRMSTSALLASSDGSSSGGERHVPSLSPLHQQQSSVAALYEYSQIIPDYLMPRSSTTIAKADPNFSYNSPSNANESSCGKRRNVQSKQGSNPLRELPPALPPQLNRIILNTRPSVARQQSSSGQRQKIDPNALSVPDHVCLNHVYALSIRDDVMGLATTFRYRNKYSTVILYRPTDCSTFT